MSRLISKKYNVYEQECSWRFVPLNQQQTAFIHRFIQYIENNSHFEDIKILINPPFDKPHSFIKVFDV